MLSPRRHAPQALSCPVAPAAPQTVARRAAPAHERVVFHARGDGRGGHDTATKARLAEGMATLLGLDYGGMHVAGDAPPAGRCYFVPEDTLHAEDATRLGIRGPRDLYGGVVPANFVATKVITHPLVHLDSAAPAGWSPAFADSVRAVVLPGYSVFTAADARDACARLFASGTVRYKAADGVGGAGQTVLGSGADLERVLRAIDPADLRRSGAVLERNLDAVRTHSVGQVRVGAWLLSYHGRQRLTRDQAGRAVYGGSDLRLVRGDYRDLLALPLDAEARRAVEQAITYHQAALQAFSGLYASRSNYDVADGTDASGTSHTGVLEQSWRIGGASGAELVALQAWQGQPDLRWVDASTHEVYDAQVRLPAAAQLHYDGRDDRGARLVKYAMVNARGDP
jgi:hypothetical protein